MSTDTRPATNPDPRESGDEEPAKPRIELSVTQVLGGALAAMTAAFLGSRLSVAGTVVGAALASVVAAVAGSVYTASLRTTHARVRTVFSGHVAGSELPTSVDEVPATTPAALTSAPGNPAAPAAGASTSLLRRLSWKDVTIAALAAFALAVVALTGVELAAGRALSGGEGTTVAQVTEPRRPAEPTAPTTVSPTPSASASASPTASATPEPSATPTPAPSVPATPAPTTEPSTAAPSPSSTPTAPASPSPDATPTEAPAGAPADLG